MNDVLGVWFVNVKRDGQRREFHYEERRVTNLMNPGKELKEVMIEKKR